MFRVMIADDEIWVIKNLLRLVDWSNYNMTIVHTATDGIEALNLIRESPPDMLITDIRMPGIDGLKLLEHCREINPKMVCIILSGYAEFDYAQSAMRLKAFDYLLKPIDKEALEHLLVKVVHHLADVEGNPANAVSSANKKNPEQPSIEIIAMNEHITQVIEYIGNYYQSDLSLESVADEMHLNPSYLSNLFSRSTNTTFSKYLSSVRIEKATQFLLYTNYTVEAIAEKVGFADYRQFIKTFKRICGETPAMYRKSRNGGFNP